VIGSLTSVSIYAEQLVTALGLGLAIDYSLLVVNRFREQLAAGAEPGQAVAATITAAGRTVLFSAFTVAAALSALLVFPLYFLRSMAYAGIAVVAIAAAGATVVLPALLAVLGRRVNAGHLRFLGALDGHESQFWLRSTRLVLRRPLLAGGAVLAVLLLAAAPLLHVRSGIPDDRVLPASAASRQAGDALRHSFPLDSGNTVAVVTSRPLSPAQSSAYAARLSAVPASPRCRAPRGPGRPGTVWPPAPCRSPPAPPGCHWPRPPTRRAPPGPPRSPPSGPSRFPGTPPPR
jgi:putative drug exporter of the RND superfamily